MIEYKKLLSKKFPKEVEFYDSEFNILEKRKYRNYFMISLRRKKEIMSPTQWYYSSNKTYEYSFAEIGEQLNLSKTEVMNIYYSAIGKLKTMNDKRESPLPPANT